MNKTSPFYLIKKYLGLFIIRSFGWLVYLVGGRQTFFKTGDKAWVQQLESKSDKIREELLAVMRSERIPGLQEFFEEQQVLTKAQDWQSYILSLYGFDHIAHCEACPNTFAAIDEVPGMSVAMFSILKPGKHIPLHRGPYPGVLRLHLPLVLPDKNEECYLLLDGEKRHWNFGEALLFDDTYEHEVYNNTTDTRVVLFVDIIRPLPFPLDKVNQLLFGLLRKSEFIQEALAKLNELDPSEIRKRDFSFKN